MCKKCISIEVDPVFDEEEMSYVCSKCGSPIDEVDDEIIPTVSLLLGKGYNPVMYYSGKPFTKEESIIMTADIDCFDVKVKIIDKPDCYSFILLDTEELPASALLYIQSYYFGNCISCTTIDKILGRAANRPDKITQILTDYSDNKSILALYPTDEIEGAISLLSSAGEIDNEPFKGYNLLCHIRKELYVAASKLPEVKEFDNR